LLESEHGPPDRRATGVLDDEIRRLRRVLVTAGVAVTVVLGVAGCRALSSRSAVVLLDGVALRCEVADTPQRRLQGLQGRDALAQGEGMLFVNDAPQPVTIQMKDVGYPIDVTFVDERRRVMKIAGMYPDNARAVTSSAPVLYVIETPSGWMGANGIGVGSDMGFLGQAP
jgi:uncharacterized membrane protein (UPF0127 family)